MLEGKNSKFQVDDLFLLTKYLSLRYFQTYEGWIVARLIDRTTRVDCYYSVAGVEFMCTQFDFLTGSAGDYQWVRTMLGDIPHCGVRPSGLVGIGRGLVNGDTVLGKIFPPIFAMFAGYHNAEHRFESYDALTRVC